MNSEVSDFIRWMFEFICKCIFTAFI